MPAVKIHPKVLPDADPTAGYIFEDTGWWGCDRELVWGLTTARPFAVMSR
jgi:hypothetical protein